MLGRRANRKPPRMARLLATIMTVPKWTVACRKGSITGPTLCGAWLPSPRTGPMKRWLGSWLTQGTAVRRPRPTSTCTSPSTTCSKKRGGRHPTWFPTRTTSTPTRSPRVRGRRNPDCRVATAG
uniref:Uncharacterized protein n=1 Tax=Ixodes ricinus TaxID=34613 RepID=A0A6B0UQ91_IXORI